MSPQVLRTTRALEKETVQVEAFLSLDGQGAPSYATAVDVEANVVRVDEYVTMPDGSEVSTPVVLYVVGDAPYLPREQDRVELGSGNGTWVVARRTEPRGLRRSRSAVDHVRLACRRET